MKKYHIISKKGFAGDALRYTIGATNSAGRPFVFNRMVGKASDELVGYQVLTDYW